MNGSGAKEKCNGVKFIVLEFLLFFLDNFTAVLLFSFFLASPCLEYLFYTQAERCEKLCKNLHIFLPFPVAALYEITTIVGRKCFISWNICHAKTINSKYIPLATGDTIKIFANAAPCPWPIKVTMFGLPLNAGRFSLSQCKPATRSISPKFPWALPFVPVFKNPDCDVEIIARKRKKRNMWRINNSKMMMFFCSDEMSWRQKSKSQVFVNIRYNLCAYMLEQRSIILL